MALSRQRAAYKDCYEIFDAAARDPSGCRTCCGPRYSDAEYLRARMHRARTLLRALSRDTYEPGDPLYNTSDFDMYKLTIKPDTADEFWLYVEPQGNWKAVAAIEPIPEDERIVPMEAPPPAIEHRRVPALQYSPEPSDELE